MKEHIKSVLITGANSGLGKEAARQFALESSIQKIYLACRSPEKGNKAKAELESATNTKKFEVIQLDTTKSVSINNAVATLPAVDSIILNAGGFGDKNAKELTSDGVTQIFAVNVLGHARLAEKLLIANKVNTSVTFISSEIARGSEALKAPAPSFKNHSVEEFKAAATGELFDKWDAMNVYGYVKYIGTLWLSHLATKYPNIRFNSVSPGSTSGTNAAENFPLPMKLMFKYVMFPIILPLKGLAHKPEQGAKRYVDVTMNAAYNNGVFYGSEAHTLTGKIVDQGSFFNHFRNQHYQKNAYDAVSSFLQ